MLFGLTLPLAAIAQGQAATDPGLRACAAETDSQRRLACYDREMARQAGAKPAPSANGAPQTAGAHSSAPPIDAAKAAATADTQTAAVPAPAGSSPPVRTATAGTPEQRSAPAAGDTRPGMLDRARAAFSKASGGDTPPVTARLVSAQGLPNEMVLKLDNGQVWQQLDGGGSLSLQPGDTVKIERHLGSYWLSAPHVSGVKVRQKE